MDRRSSTAIGQTAFANGASSLKTLGKNFCTPVDRVTPHGDAWDVKKDGAERSSKHAVNKEEAVQFAREIAQREGLELVIHTRDGQISQKDSHGNDSNPPKG